jgi:hypothetical protein
MVPILKCPSPVQGLSLRALCGRYPMIAPNTCVIVRLKAMTTYNYMPLVGVEENLSASMSVLRAFAALGSVSVSY